MNEKYKLNIEKFVKVMAFKKKIGGRVYEYPCDWEWV